MTALFAKGDGLTLQKVQRWVSAVQLAQGYRILLPCGRLETP